MSSIGNRGSSGNVVGELMLNSNVEANAGEGKLGGHRVNMDNDAGDIVKASALQVNSPVEEIDKLAMKHILRRRIRNGKLSKKNGNDGDDFDDKEVDEVLREDSVDDETQMGYTGMGTVQIRKRIEKERG